MRSSNAIPVGRIPPTFQPGYLLRRLVRNAQQVEDNAPLLRMCSMFIAGIRPAPLRLRDTGNPAPVPLVPVVQSSPRALTVPSARFTPHLRVALPFGQVSTGHPLPSGAVANVAKSPCPFTGRRKGARLEATIHGEANHLLSDADCDRRPGNGQ